MDGSLDCEWTDFFASLCQELYINQGIVWQSSAFLLQVVHGLSQAVMVDIVRVVISWQLEFLLHVRKDVIESLHWGHLFSHLKVGLLCFFSGENRGQCPDFGKSAVDWYR